MSKADAQTATETAIRGTGEQLEAEIAAEIVEDILAGTKRVLCVADSIAASKILHRAVAARLQELGALAKSLGGPTRTTHSTNGSTVYFLSWRSKGSGRGVCADSLYFIGHPGDWSEHKFELLPTLARSPKPHVRLAILDDQ